VGHIDLYPTLLNLLGLPLPAQQKIDGVSYARVLKSEGGLERKAFFNYFPHGKSPGKAGGVWARSGDWKLIRWFGVLPDDVRYELYNLREDLSETKNLAINHLDRVKEMDALIDEFLADTGAAYPRPNPAYKPTAAKPVNPRVAADPSDPLLGWKVRQCDASVKDDILTITAKPNIKAMFLGHVMGRTTGPVAFALRVRSATGGEGKVEWLGDTKAGAEPKSVPFKVAAGGWQEIAVEVPAQGVLGTTRVYLPASPQPLDVDWIELRHKGPDAKPQRWDFKGK
jgi:hypothetical protein